MEVYNETRQIRASTFNVTECISEFDEFDEFDEFQLECKWAHFQTGEDGTKRDTGRDTAFLEQPKEWVSRLWDVNIPSTSRGSDTERI